MSVEEIGQRQHQEGIKFETARLIRELLDKAQRDYEQIDGDWEGDEVEDAIQALVFEEA